MKTDLSLYLHMPFCVRKCFYCDFLSGPFEESVKQRYLSALIKEIKRAAPRYGDYVVRTVFLGGGTPSLVSPERLLEVMQVLRGGFCIDPEAEITIEVNPGTADFEKLTAYRAMGINRLSIGLQSAQNKELALLGRIHTAEDFFRTYADAVKSGFNNINIDLMSAIPGQSIESWENTLRQVLSLRPAPVHLSAYSLIIEEGTPFYEHTPPLPDEETDRLLYKITNDILKEKGYRRYEISNYALEGFACRHNQVYWKRGNYLGLGLGAASLVENVRFQNCREMNRYLKALESEEGLSSIRENEQILSVPEQMEEFMFLGLRLTEGVWLSDFKKSFGKELSEVYPGVLERLEKQGLLLSLRNERGERERIYLSELGLDVSNVAMAEFLLT